jgi:hypothetical protein
MFLLFPVIGSAQTPPLTRLTDVFCFNYNLPALYSNFSAIKQTCDGYIFEVENQTTMQSASLTTYGSVAGRTTNLSNFPAAGIQYSTTYRVRVRTWIGTPSNVGGYSAVNCFVITPPATSKIQPSQCNTTLSTLNTPIYADNIVGAQSFEYELKKLPGGTINTFEKTTGTLNAFSMADFSNSFVDYNTTYEVRVRVKVNSTYGPYGTVCNITTPSIPSSQLSNYCNGSIPYLNTSLPAEQIEGADAYKFEVTDGTNTTEIFPNAPGYTAVLIPVAWATYSGTPSNISWVTYNMTVQIRVAVFVDGVWQPYGPSCSVTTPCGSRLTAAMAGKIINYLHYDELIAETTSCANLEDYQFRYRNSITSNTYVTASSGTEASESSTDNKVFISDFGPISNFPGSNPYGNNYRISVRVKTAGVWSPWGIERQVSTLSSPTTKIRDGVYPVAGSNQCGSSFSFPFLMTSIATILGSYNLYGFSSATFEVTELDALGNDVITKYLTRQVSTYGAMARSFRLNMVEATTPTGSDGYWASKYNTVFRVRVATNLGTYGDACYVKTPASIEAENLIELYDQTLHSDELASTNQTIGNTIDSTTIPLKDVLFFPNPFTNKLNVQYSDQFAEMNTISVRDMTGKSIIMLNSSLDDFIALDILKDLQIGVYYIDICSSKGQRTICRLIKG